MPMHLLQQDNVQSAGHYKFKLKQGDCQYTILFITQPITKWQIEREKKNVYVYVYCLVKWVF